MLLKLGGFAWGMVGTLLVVTGGFGYHMGMWMLGNLLCLLGLYLWQRGRI